MKHIVFNKELMTIKNENVRNFTKYLLDNAPDYFYSVPASSSGRFHPKYALGEGGLVRHTKALVGIMNHLLELEQYQVLFSELQRDFLRLAGLTHDIRKHGDGTVNHTVFEHPLLASNWIKEQWIEFGNQGNIGISANALAFVQECLESHMGQWNTNKISNVVLPKPTTEAQKFVHMCDYLASRKNLEYLFDTDEQDFKPQAEIAMSLEQYRLPFGKYRDRLIIEVAKEDMGYLLWLNDREGLDSTLRRFLQEVINNKN